MPQLPSLKKKDSIAALDSLPDQVKLSGVATAPFPSLRPIDEKPWGIHPLPELPKVGEPLTFSETSGLSRVVSELMASPKAGPGNSDWSDPQDLRLVIPVVRRRSGSTEVAYEILPGRGDQRLTVKTGRNNADAKLNGDGLQTGIRIGATGQNGILPPRDGQSNGLAFHPMEVQWAEFRLGAEGLVFTGRVQQGSFEITRFELEKGYFQAKLDGLGAWAKENLAVAIPLGILGAGVAAVALQQTAKLMKHEISLPIGATVFKHDGFALRPSVRTLLTSEGDVRFGGAELGASYQIGRRAAVQLLPRYNHDPKDGPTGFSVGARATLAIPYGLAGVEVRVDDDGNVSTFAGVGGVF